MGRRATAVSARTMRTLGFVPIKSRRLMPGGYRETTRWASKNCGRLLSPSWTTRHRRGRLIDAADLLHVEGAVGELFTVKAEKQVQDTQNAPIGHLVAETSCEARNLFLDRALIVDTVGRIGAGFF